MIKPQIRFYIYGFRSLNHTSVISLHCHFTATVAIADDCGGFFILIFTFFGSIWVQHVLQYVFAFARRQIVEEIQWCNLNESKRRTRN